MIWTMARMEKTFLSDLSTHKTRRNTMATKKPTVKKAKTAKKPLKFANKPAAKDGSKGKVKIIKTVSAPKVKSASKKITIKPPKPSSELVKKSKKNGLAKPMAKFVVDRITLPKGGKVFVKAAKRPAVKKAVKKTVKKTK